MKQMDIIIALLVFLATVITFQVGFSLGKSKGIDEAIRLSQKDTINCFGSWPDPHWTIDDYKKKEAKLNECQSKYGAKSEGIIWITY